MEEIGNCEVSVEAAARQERGVRFPHQGRMQLYHQQPRLCHFQIQKRDNDTFL